MARVEEGRRFVEEQDLGSLGQGSGDKDQPPFTRAEFQEGPPGIAFEPDEAKGLLGDPPVGGRRAGEGREISGPARQDEIKDRVIENNDGSWGRSP
jgi:hypothetical protein